MGTLLESIHSPADVKRLSHRQLEQLSREIRTVLVATVAENGGHLAANLGVVELTVALHRVYDSPQDKIVWDVGHQSYVHKMLTGRRQAMPTLRTRGGLSGFPKVEESEHDAFNTGHSSTSISAALGMALARDLQGGHHQVVAVIGDGALTGGMAFEAMNHAGHLGTDLTVVLNDNEMSISRNVGALSTYLSRLRSDPAYVRRKEEIEGILQRIPGIGPNIARAAVKFKDTVKYLVVPGMLFEELGFTYIGPIDGHNLEELVRVLAQSKQMRGPVLIHVITQKGRGYEPALRNPDEFHGIGPFDVETGEPLRSRGATYTQLFGECLLELAEMHPELVAISAAMKTGTGLARFAERYPHRFFDVGICEQHAVTLAAGMARQGLRPVVAIYSTFLQRAYDQIVHDVCLQGLPVVFALDRAGLVGEDGPTHHGVFDLSYLRHIPGIVVMAPADENEFVDMLHASLGYGRPVAIRYPRGAGAGAVVQPERRPVPLGSGRVLQEGRDVVLLAVGRGVQLAREAAEHLEAVGVAAALADGRFVKPLDGELLARLVRGCPRLVTVEDNVVQGGFGAAVLEALAEQHLQAEVEVVGIPDRFVEHGSVPQLQQALGLDGRSLAVRVLQRWPHLERGVLRVVRRGEN